VNREQELLNDNKGAHRTAFVKLFRLWAELTNEEQKAILTVLALFLLGLTVHVWHLQAKTAVSKHEINPYLKQHQERVDDHGYQRKAKNAK